MNEELGAAAGSGSAEKDPAFQALNMHYAQLAFRKNRNPTGAETGGKITAAAPDLRRWKHEAGYSAQRRANSKEAASAGNLDYLFSSDGHRFPDPEMDYR